MRLQYVSYSRIRDFQNPLQYSVGADTTRNFYDESAYQSWWMLLVAPHICKWIKIRLRSRSWQRLGTKTCNFLWPDLKIPFLLAMLLTLTYPDYMFSSSRWKHWKLQALPWPSQLATSVQIISSGALGPTIHPAIDELSCADVVNTRSHRSSRSVQTFDKNPLTAISVVCALER